MLDPAISPGVNFSEPGGISPEQLFGAVNCVKSTGKLGAAAIANFNPDRDPFKQASINALGYQVVRYAGTRGPGPGAPMCGDGKV